VECFFFTRILYCLYISHGYLLKYSYHYHPFLTFFSLKFKIVHYRSKIWNSLCGEFVNMNFHQILLFICNQFKNLWFIVIQCNKNVDTKLVYTMHFWNNLYQVLSKPKYLKAKYLKVWEQENNVYIFDMVLLTLGKRPDACVCNN